MSNVRSEIEEQRRYYAETAGRYDAMHVDAKDEHFLALSFLVSACEHLEVRSVLDIGSGTGRAVSYLKSHRPGMRVVGIEPVKELRDVGHLRGLAETDLIAGDATRLAYAAGDFDLVCEFGVLHHVRHPSVIVSEMLRVAGKAVFLSDSNNFGQGSRLVRLVKQTINLAGLWRVADLIKTGGKGYTVTAGDGVSYSYSVFNNYGQIRAQCQSVHLLNTRDGGANPYRTASHVALLGIKK